MPLSETELEDQLNLSYELGQVVAFERLVARLKKNSGELFTDNREQEAIWLKSLACELEKETQDMRKDYNKKRDQAKDLFL